MNTMIFITITMTWIAFLGFAAYFTSSKKVRAAYRAKDLAHHRLSCLNHFLQQEQAETLDRLVEGLVWRGPNCDAVRLMQYEPGRLMDFNTEHTNEVQVRQLVLPVETYRKSAAVARHETPRVAIMNVFGLKLSDRWMAVPLADNALHLEFKPERDGRYR